jgi:ribonucleoside-diphosphate reductase alpha chain
MISDTSGGIEPVFSVAYQKNVGEDIQGDDMLVEFDSYFVSTLAENNIDVEETKAEATRLMKNNEWDGVQSLSTVPDDIAEVFVTTNDLSSRQHGMMQRAFQAAVDSGISKTVNLPKEADHADVHDAYMLALTDEERGAPIKGLTVYRDQSREEQVKTTQQYSDLEIESAINMLDDLGYEIDEPENRGEN